MPYGEKLAERLQATSASVIMTRVLRKAVSTATEIQSDHPNRGRSNRFHAKEHVPGGIDSLIPHWSQGTASLPQISG